MLFKCIDFESINRNVNHVCQSKCPKKKLKKKTLVLEQSSKEIERIPSQLRVSNFPFYFEIPARNSSVVLSALLTVVGIVAVR